jgi:hypothetical protein
MTKERDYSKGLIYKIEHLNKPELVYVGSTTNFNKRKYHHKQCCYNEKFKDYNNKKYKMIRENGDWESFKMVVIKEYPCNNKTELEIEEEKCRKELQAVLNERRCHRTEEEKVEYNKAKSKKFFNENKEKCLEKRKEYVIKNKEKISEKINCDCGSFFKWCGKARHEQSKKHQNFINK